MINHVWGLFTRPNSEWQEIRGEEQTSHPRIYALFVLAAIPPVSAFIGTTRVGWARGNAPAVRLTEASALPLAVFSYLAMLAGVVVMGWFIHWMARTYHANPTLRQCVMFAAYTATPLFLAGLAALYPNLWLALLVGTAAVAYTAYLLYVGLPTFMGIHPDEGFLFASSVLAVGLVVLVAMLAASVVIWGMGIGPVYTL